MTQARSQLIDLDATAYYHCTSRCVRRAFLCGEDPVTGFNFEHRRQWIEDRLKALAGLFALDLCAYAVMSNHYHVVLRINRDQCDHWDDAEVIARWSKLYRVPEWVGHSEADPARVASVVRIWRARLMSISWFMRAVNEPLARWANQEDGCKGRFWEGRFGSQALLDEEALLKCMVYVDLNPIRAGISSTPEHSDHTSIKARIERDDDTLAPLANKESKPGFVLPIGAGDYLSLVDWTGRQWRSDKPGKINAQLPGILERLNTEQEDWVASLKGLMKRYCRAIGSVPSLLAYREHLGQQRLRGVSG